MMNVHTIYIIFIYLPGTVYYRLKHFLLMFKVSPGIDLQLCTEELFVIQVFCLII